MECGVQPSLLTGWDCHGLPIELKAIKGGKRLEASKVANITTIKRQNKTLKESHAVFPQTREIAGKFAGSTVEAQSREFQGWGLMADWENRYRFNF